MDIFLYVATNPVGGLLKMVLTLYKQDISSAVRTVHMVIASLGISDVEYVEIDLIRKEQFKEDFLKLNPQHTVPTLVDDEFVIWDSHAISTYLITVYGENNALYPEESKQRARVDQRLHFDSGVLFPALRAAVLDIFHKDPKMLSPETLEKISKAYEFTDKFLEVNPWMAGDEITVADMSCVATISTMDAFAPVEATLYPKLFDWLQRCSKQEFYKKGNQPGLMQLSAMIKSKLGQT